MKRDYKRENLTITEFDTEDVITTSGEVSPEETVLAEHENSYGLFSRFNKAPGSWF